MGKRTMRREKGSCRLPDGSNFMLQPSVWCTLLLCAGFLIGCSADSKDETDKSAPVITEIATEEKNVTNAPELNTAAEPDEWRWENVRLKAQGEEIGFYEDFLNGNCAAVVGEDFHGKSSLHMDISAGEYKLSELICAAFGGDTDAGYDIQVSYALTDIGGDGRQELFVKCKGSRSYFVLAFYFDDGKLHLSFMEYAGERSSLILTKDGYVESANGNASGYDSECGRMGADGRYETWYKIEAGTGWGIMNLPILPREERWDVYTQFFGTENEPLMEAYVYTIGEQIYYEYFIQDEATNEERALCEQYVAVCEDTWQVHFSTEEEIRQALRQRRESLGIAEDIKKVKETDLEWVTVKTASVEKRAQAAYLALLAGDFSLLDDPKIASQLETTIFPTGNLEYTMLDVDYDGVSELLLQWVAEPSNYNAVFHYASEKLIVCWNNDDVELTCYDYPLKDGTMVQQYNYGGASSYTVFHYDHNGNTQVIARLFAREEIVFDNSTEPCPFYKIGEQVVDEETFQAALKEIIYDNLLERDAWSGI